LHRDDSSRHAHTRLRQCSELLEELLRFQQPADQIIERYFKAHRAMGAKDRRFAAETVYACLRHRRALLCAAGPLAELGESTRLLATHLLTECGWSGRALIDAGIGADFVPRLVQYVRQANPAKWSFAERHSLPDWLAQALLAARDAAGAEACAQALNRPAPVDLRVNTLRTSRQALADRLSALDLPCSATPYSEVGLRRKQRGPLFQTQEFQRGEFELQDEGSQLVGQLVAAKPRQRVVDFCAGAGGKSLQLAAAMRNRGEVLACDVAEYRLERLRRRARRAGCDNVRTLAIASEHDVQLMGLRGGADAVLVDAPCSGSGTLRRNPDLKWRLAELGDLPRQQLSILLAAAELLRPGGRLVYATCSFVAAENDAVRAQFLARRADFRPAAREEAASGGVPIELVDADGQMVLWPDRHGCDGFYGAVFLRTASAVR
jgi:16S rRNA (cytosine967-C5)-methyltransferase